MRERERETLLTTQPIFDLPPLPLTAASILHALCVLCCLGGGGGGGEREAQATVTR